MEKIAEKAAEKATEYCLLGIDWWPICMAKGEWASWVQAVFSVVAIGAAIWLGGRADAESARGARNHLRIFFEASRISLGRTWQSAKAEDIAGLHYGRALIRDAIQLGHSVPMQLLTQDKAEKAARCRAAISSAEAATDVALSADWRKTACAHLATELVELSKEVEDLLR